MKKIVSFIMVCVLLIGCIPLSASAAEENAVQPCYEEIISFTTRLAIDSEGAAACYGKVTVAPSGCQINFTMRLKRLENGYWNTVKSWTTSGSNILSLNKTWYIVPGYNYRVFTTAVILDEDGNYIETGTHYSDIQSY